MTGAATWKLRLPRSVAVLSTARSARPAERRPARLALHFNSLLYPNRSNTQGDSDVILFHIYAS